jgi:hypothetical protein
VLVNEYNPPIVGVKLNVPSVKVAAVTAPVPVNVKTCPERVSVALAGAVPTAKVASVIVVPFGSFNTYVVATTSPLAALEAICNLRSIAIAVPCGHGAATVHAVADVTVVVWVIFPKAAACAGTTDRSPNPSEATATADTFFNEIVFTIFLSFSQIKDDLLSGW